MSNKNLFKSLWLLMLFLVVGTVSAQKVAKIGLTEYATFADAMSAVQDGDIIYLLADADASNVAFTPCNNKTVIIAGKTGNEVLNMGTGHKGGIQNSNITFLNLKMQIRHSTVSGTWYTEGMYHATKIKYENVVIDGAICTYDDVDFLNCTFTNNPQNAEYTTWNYGGTQIFKGCTFETASAGTKSFIKLFNQGAAASVAVVDCEFKDPSTLPSGWKGCDIYNSNPASVAASAKIYTDNNTYTGDKLVGHSGGSEIITVCNSAAEMGITLPTATVLPSVGPTGYNGATLPASPVVEGDVINVTAANAQYVLDGAYGAIDGKTINFTENITEKLVLGRPTKYEGSNTEYRHGSFENDAMSYEDFIAYKNQNGWTEYSYYNRAISGVTFTANEDITIAGFTACGGAHVYGTTAAPIYDYVRDNGTWCYDTNNGYYVYTELKNIKFDGLTFTGNVDFSTSSDNTVFDNFEFNGCTFNINNTTKVQSNQAIRYYSEGVKGNVKNLLVENCTFNKVYQAVYTMKAVGIHIEGNTVAKTSHNVFCIMTGGKVFNSGEVVINNNTVTEAGHPMVRLENVASGTTITIKDNDASYGNGTEVTDEKFIEAGSVAEGVTVVCSGNKMHNFAAPSHEVFNDKAPTVSIDVHEEVEISGTETATEAEKTAANEAVIALESNTAVTTEESTNVADVEEVTTLAITVKEVAVETKTEESVAVATVTKVTYDVQPMKDEVKVTETEQPLTFRLPVPQSFTNEIVKVSHDHKGNVETFSAFVQGTGAAKYVELASTKFSDWTIEDIATLESLEITTANDLVKLSTYVNAGNSLSGKTVKLANDIDMSSVANFAPIGTNSHRFAGTFDGQNNTISNLTITGTNGCLGLFGYSDHALIKDVTIDKASVTGSGTWGGVASGGAFVSTFDNVTVINSTVNVDGAYIGAIAGGNYPIVRNCTVTETSVKGKDQVGGIAGYVCGTTIENNTLTKVAVEATEERAGGLIGKWQRADNNVCTVKNNTITEGSAKAPDMAGGIAAQIMGNNEKYSIKYNTIDVTLNAPKTSPIGVLRSSQPVAFTETLAQNIKLNWWTDATLNAETYTYTETETNGAGDQVITRGVPVAKIGEEGYASLAEAVAAVQNDETITLTQDITLDKAVAIGTSANKHARQFTIDFDGKTVTGKANTTMFTVYDDVTFTGNGQADYYGQGQFAYAINAYGNVTIDGVNITDKKNNAGNILKANSGATITLKNGVVTSDKPRGGMVNVANGGAFVMEDGKIVCNYESYNQAYACVYVATGGSATIKGGEMKAAAAAVWVDGIANIEGGKVTAPYTVWVNKGTANISGGKFYANPTAVYLYTATSVANISGGEFWATGTDSKYLINKLDAVRDGAVANITGGIFHDFDPMSNTAEGEATDFTPDNKCTSDAEGVFTVGDCHHTVEVVGTEGKKHYDTLAAAVTAATEGQTITMLSNVDITTGGVTIAEGKNITLDLNGHDIKAGEQNTNNITVNGKLTLEDNSTEHNGKIYTEEPYSRGVAETGVVRVVGGEFVMNSGNIYAVIESDPANNGQFGVVLWNGAKATINGGQIKAGWYAIANNGSDATTMTITINGGELISTTDYAIYQPAKNSSLNVTDGVVYGATGAIAANAGTVNVTGGTITSKGQGSTGTWGDGTGGLGNAAINVNARYGNTTCAISGGTITAEGDAVTLATNQTYTGTIVVSGGNFSSVIPKKYCALGFAPVTEPNEQGLYEVKELDLTLRVYTGSDSYTDMKIAAFVAHQEENPNAMALVSSEYEQYVAGLTNVIVDYTVGHNNHYYECENFELTDGYDWYSPVKEFTAVKGSYSRTIYDGLNAICVPFEIGEGVPFTKHVFHSSNEAGTTAYFNSITNVNAGKAFIAQVSGTSSWIFNFDNTPIFDNPMEGGAFRGTYRDSNVSNCYKINDAGTGLQYHSTAMNYAFRGYFVLENENLFGGQPNNLRIAFDEIEDDTTGISAIGNGTNVDVIYNVQGLRLSKQQKGINILNGKKVLK